MDKTNLELCIKLRHELHKHPELANNEVWTKPYLMSFLRQHTELLIVDRGLWFYAAYVAGDDKTNIAFRADFDALPMAEGIDISHASKIAGAAHKCGHDGHAASLVGLALEVDQEGADKNVYFIFQHAEETGEGAICCRELLAEKNITEIFAYHNLSGLSLGAVSIIDGTCFCASKGMTIEFKGVSAHASEPEKGKNPAFAVAKIIGNIEQLLLQGKGYKGMVLCTIIQVDIGEKAFGLSASLGKLLLTIRALFDTDLLKLQYSLENLARVEAKKYGLKVNIQYQDIFPATVNHKESSEKIRMACVKKGIEIREMKEAFKASEDFGHYLNNTKGAIFFIGNGEEYPPLHSCSYDFPDAVIEVAVDLFKQIMEL